MKGLILNKPSRVTRNKGYFNMIADEFIKPSTRAENLNESYFKAYVKKQYTNKAPAEVIAQAKKFLRDSNNPVYFKPDFEKTLSIDDIAARVLLSETQAMGSLNNAKGTKNAIIDDLARTRYVQFSKSKAIKEVEGSIASGIASNDIGKSGNTSRFNQLLSELLEYKAYWAVAAAYAAEYNKRLDDSKAVTAAIEKGDVAALKALRSKVNVTELKTNIDDAIKAIEDAKKAEAEAQKAAAQSKADAEKAAEAARKAEEERLAAINKAAEELANATTPEQKAAAQAKLDALRSSSGSSEGGIPKMVIYGGIGLVVVVGAYLMFRKKA
jgi:hypothetical protein